MESLLDDPQDGFSENDLNFLKKIQKFDFQINHVMGEDGFIDFSYTTGLFLNLGFPELIVFAVNQELAHSFFWEFHRRATTGEHIAVGDRVDGMIQNHPIQLGPVSNALRVEHLVWADWFYKRKKFEALQIIVPNTSGVFPWQSDNHDFIALQTDMSGNSWMKGK